MNPTFFNANYYRNDLTDETSESYKELLDNDGHNIVAVHSKLLISDMNGVYIPRIFATSFDLHKWNLKEDSEDIKTVEAGPEHHYYWEAWVSLTNKAYRVDENGNKWFLEQDGDLWARLYIEKTKQEILDEEVGL